MWPNKKADCTAIPDAVEIDGCPDDLAGETDLEETAPTAKSISTVRHRAVRLLSRREHGRLELREKLLQRNLPAAEIDIALDQLAEKGLQCDVRFAESYTRMRVNRGFGPNKITADLQTRKLSREVIADAIAETEVNWISNAVSALLKKYGDPDNSCGRVTADVDFGKSASDRARMQRFLHSRGYNHSQISAAINQLRQRVE